MKPKVKVEGLIYDGPFQTYEFTRVTVDDVVLSCDRYGGEPEDATRGRTYAWVESVIAKLAERLGADVELSEKAVTEKELEKLW